MLIELVRQKYYNLLDCFLIIFGKCVACEWCCKYSYVRLFVLLHIHMVIYARTRLISMCRRGYVRPVQASGQLKIAMQTKRALKCTYKHTTIYIVTPVYAD